MPYRDSIIHTPNLESKLDLRPLGGYEESLEALDSLLDEEYETASDTAAEMHPRVSHEVFRYTGFASDNKALLETDMIEEIQDTLESNSEKNYWWLEDKLFNLGYRRFPRSPNLRKLRRSPQANHLSDNIHVPLKPFSTSYGRGKEKRESDEYYFWANNFLIEDIADREILIK